MVSDVNVASAEDAAATVASSLHYITSKEGEPTRGFPYYTWSLCVCLLGEFVMKEMTVWLIADLSTSQGRQVARSALNYTVSHSSSLSLSLFVCLSRLLPPPLVALFLYFLVQCHDYHAILFSR